MELKQKRRCKVCGEWFIFRINGNLLCKLHLKQYRKEYWKEYQKSPKYKEYQKSPKYKEYQKEYWKEYQKSPEYKEYMKEYRKEYRESPEYKEYQKEYHKKYHKENINNLLDAYIKEKLKRQGYDVITPELIELKRQEIMLKREIKKGKEMIDEYFNTNG